MQLHQLRDLEIRRVGVLSRVSAFTFESGPFLTYPKSYDVFGDGSAVGVPTFGHTRAVSPPW